VFVSVFGGALFGMFLRGRLSEHHLSPETKDLVKLGVGLIGTMSALVPGPAGRVGEGLLRHAEE
jgi:hypothetical protein